MTQRIVNRPRRVPGECACTLEFEPRERYLFVHVTGEADSVEISLGYWQMVAAECRRLGFHRVLVHEELKALPSTLDTFAVASNLADVGMRGITIAFVDTDTRQAAENSFGETVAGNRGVRGRFFSDLRDAEEWIASLPNRRIGSPSGAPLDFGQ